MDAQGCDSPSGVKGASERLWITLEQSASIQLCLYFIILDLFVYETDFILIDDLPLTGEDWKRSCSWSQTPVPSGVFVLFRPQRSHPQVFSCHPALQFNIAIQAPSPFPNPSPCSHASRFTFILLHRLESILPIIKDTQLLVAGVYEYVPLYSKFLQICLNEVFWNRELIWMS